MTPADVFRLRRLQSLCHPLQVAETPDLLGMAQDVV